MGRVSMGARPPLPQHTFPGRASLVLLMQVGQPAAIPLVVWRCCELRAAIHPHPPPRPRPRPCSRGAACDARYFCSRRRPAFPPPVSPCRRAGLVRRRLGRTSPSSCECWRRWWRRWRARTCRHPTPAPAPAGLPRGPERRHPQPAARSARWAPSLLGSTARSARPSLQRRCRPRAHEAWWWSRIAAGTPRGPRTVVATLLLQQLPAM
jgi:hypothetical protein